LTRFFGLDTFATGSAAERVALKRHAWVSTEEAHFMEHRFGLRERICLGINIYMDHLPTLKALTRNISGHGLNLALTHPKLTRNCMVKIVLTVGGMAEVWQSWALVVHSSVGGGTGLMLEDELPIEIYNAYNAASLHCATRFA